VRPIARVLVFRSVIFVLWKYGFFFRLFECRSEGTRIGEFVRVFLFELHCCFEV